MIYSVTNGQHRWVAIVRADNYTEAVMVALLAMDGTEQDGDEVHVHHQDYNKDAAQRIGDRQLIGWHLIC
jgi:expansin (peptidoglycan-binding protein)